MRPGERTEHQQALAWLFGRARAGRERGPAPARALLDRLGAPDARFGAVRVVGTNGKGSVCAMLEAGLRAAGARTGRFTSPHLTAFEERVEVGGQQLAPQRTTEFVGWAREHAPDAAFFDLTLGLACQAFAEAGVQWAVMEAGVGGASDATQALLKVRAVLLTNVALDHADSLGGTLEAIAQDKAGAARAEVPLLTTAEGAGLEVAARVAGEVGAPLLTPRTHPALFGLPRPPRLAGPHQEQNARLALATLRQLGYASPGSETALLDASWPARLERFEVDGRTVLLDGAHNPHAALALAASLSGQRDLTLLFGSLPRKDGAATLSALLPLSARRVFTVPEAGALSGDALAALAARHGGEALPDPARALAHALTLTPLGGTLLIAGSLYLAGTLRPLLMERRAPLDRT